MDNFNIEVGAAEEVLIDYSKSVDELIQFFDEKSEKINSGLETANIEFMMLGYAIDFIMWTKAATGIVLDFEEAVIPAFESILAAIHKRFSEQQPTREEFDSMMKKAAGFLCIVIAKNIPCSFISSNLGVGVKINGNHVFVMNRIGRRLQNGAEDEVVSFYEQLKHIAGIE